MRPLLLALLLLGTFVRSADLQVGGFDDIATLITRKMKEHAIPGVAFGILKNGQVTARGFGVTNVDNPQEMTPDTVFPIASISKTVTATAIMRLVEQGKLDLDAPVVKYLPDFTVQDEAATREIRIWHLLTHTPGFEGQITADDRGAQSLASFAQSRGEMPQLAPPGQIWSYNNAGFTIAGRVIEVASGQTIHNAIRSLVFQPVGLTRAFTRTEEAVTYRFAAAHRGGPDGAVTVARPVSRSPTVTAGGVWMSVADILAYARFHLGDGTGADGTPVLTRARLELMRTPRVKKVGTDDEMGLGWHLRRIGGVMTAAHGGTLGHISLLELVPERNVAFAILTNHSNGWRLIQDVERALLERFEGLKLDSAHAIGHRGLNETMPDAPMLAKQPDPAPYLGVYRRPPTNQTNTVRQDKGRLMLDNNPIAFYGIDRAVVIDGNSRGNPIEFIRRPDGTVGWIRYIGRIARKD
jgi:CubicO group peptidase (beta-lactamase class C family)